MVARKLFWFRFLQRNQLFPFRNVCWSHCIVGMSGKHHFDSFFLFASTFEFLLALPSIRIHILSDFTVVVNYWFKTI